MGKRIPFHPIAGASTVDVESRVKDLQSVIKAKRAENDEIAATVKKEPHKLEDGSEVELIVIDPDRKAAFDKNMADIRELASELKRLQDYRDVGADLDAPAGGSAAVSANAALARAASMAGMSLPEFKSLGQRLIESDAWKEFKDAQGFPKSMEYNVPSLRTKDVYSALPTGDIGPLGSVMRDPIVPRPHRMWRVRDLFSPVRTTAAIIEFFRVTGFTNNASVVPERTSGAFTVKPQSNLTIEGAAAPVRVVAHWEVASRTVLSDEPQLQGIIENELMYGLQLEEDAQILFGTGTGNDLLGICNTPNIQTFAKTSLPTGSQSADAIRHAITLSFIANYEATGVVLSPEDWETIETLKDDQGRYIVSATVQEGAQPRLWRLPVVWSRAMPQGTALVGAFGLGATLYDREQSNIRIAEQHADYFVRNAVVILAEERLALATKRPESFVKITAMGPGENS